MSPELQTRVLDYRRAIGAAGYEATRQLKEAFFALAAGAVATTLVRANLVPMSGPASAARGGFMRWFVSSPLFILLLFLLKGLLLVVLAHRSAVRACRFVLFWAVITLVTSGLFIFCMVIFEPHDDVGRVVGAVVVVIVEAFCIVAVLGRPAFARNPAARPSLRLALAYSFLVNLVSWAAWTMYAMWE